MSAPAYSIQTTDTFVRADSATLGNNWLTPGNSLAIVSNRAKQTISRGAFFTDAAYRPPSENSDAQQAEITIPGGQGHAGGTSVGVYLKFNQATGDGMLLSYDGIGNIYVYRMHSGAPTQVTISASSIPSFSNTKSYRILGYCYPGTNTTIFRIRIYDVTSGSTLVADSGEFSDNAAYLLGSKSTGFVVFSGLLGISSFISYLPNYAPNLVVGVGDSRMSGTGFNTAGLQYFSRLATAKGTVDYEFRNIGLGGKSAASSLTDAPTETAANYDPTRVNIAVIDTGTNDMGTGGKTGAQTAASVIALSQAWRNAGFFVIVFTIAPAGNGTPDYGYPADFLAKRDAANVILKTNPSSYCDVLFDLTANTFIGVGGAELNTTYYAADRVHWNDAGNLVAYNALLPVFNNLVTAIYTPPLPAPTITLTFKAGGVNVATSFVRTGRTLTVSKNGQPLTSLQSYDDLLTPGVDKVPTYSAYWSNPTLGNGLVKTAPLLLGGSGVTDGMGKTIKGIR